MCVFFLCYFKLLSLYGIFKFYLFDMFHILMQNCCTELDEWILYCILSQVPFPLINPNWYFPSASLIFSPVLLLSILVLIFWWSLSFVARRLVWGYHYNFNEILWPLSSFVYDDDDQFYHYCETIFSQQLSTPTGTLSSSLTFLLPIFLIIFPLH